MPLTPYRRRPRPFALRTRAAAVGLSLGLGLSLGFSGAPGAGAAPDPATASPAPAAAPAPTHPTAAREVDGKGLFQALIAMPLPSLTGTLATVATATGLRPNPEGYLRPAEALPASLRGSLGQSSPTAQLSGGPSSGDLTPTTADPALGCAAPIVLAARGSSERQMAPARYAGPTAGSTIVSNGWEGATIARVLRSLQLPVAEVRGLSAAEYPAVDGDDPANLPRPGVVTPMDRSVDQGVASTLALAERLAAERGCTPRFLLIGFSQGAMVLQRAERELDRRGMLAGALYMGNPYRGSFDDASIGAPAGHVGIMVRQGWSPDSRAFRATAPVVDYCLPADPVCDQDPQAPLPGVLSFPVHNTYFLGLPDAPWMARQHAEEAQVRERLSAILSEVAR